MKTNKEIKEQYEEKRVFGGEHSYEEVEAIFDDKIDIALNEAKAEGYKQGHIDTLKKLEHSIKNMYKDATSGENGGTSDQEGLSRALGLIKSEIKKVD